MLQEKKEVRLEAQNIIENQVRGKFLGGEFIIRITCKVDESETYLFDNHTFYVNRNRIKAGWNFCKIELDISSLEKHMPHINTSASIVKVTKDSRNDYQSQMIECITRDDAIVTTLQNFFRVINLLMPQERRVLIGHGILGYSYNALADKIMSPKYLQRVYVKALDNFAIGIGLGIVD